MSIITPGGLSVEAAWTKAGIGSCLRVKGNGKISKKIDLLFDCGVFDDSTIASNYIFISHGHTDHISGCIAHARAKGLQKTVANYYVPLACVDNLNQARDAFSKMDGREILMNIIGVSPGELIECNECLSVYVFATKHRVESQGYAVYLKSTSRALKNIYRGLSNIEIRNLVSEGTDIHEGSTTTLEIVYTGDTEFSALLEESNSFIFNSPILITELTYLDGPRSKASEYGHIHLEDIIENENIFQNIQQLICVHISAKYAPYSRILETLKHKLPESLLNKTVVSLKSFGAREYLTSLNDISWNDNRKEPGWGWRRESSHNNQNNHRSDSGSRSNKSERRWSEDNSQKKQNSYNSSLKTTR